MAKNIKHNQDDDCGCGKTLKITDPRRKRVGIKKTVPKKK